jgi:predicted ATPase
VSAADHASPDGVWWVELAPLPAGADLTPAVAAAPGVRQPPGADRPDTLADPLVEALAGRRLLVVLGDCEHVVEGAAALADVPPRCCPTLVLLAPQAALLAREDVRLAREPASARADGPPVAVR